MRPRSCARRRPPCPGSPRRTRSRRARRRARGAGTARWSRRRPRSASCPRRAPPPARRRAAARARRRRRRARAGSSRARSSRPRRAPPAPTRADRPARPASPGVRRTAPARRCRASCAARAQRPLRSPPSSSTRETILVPVGPPMPRQWYGPTARAERKRHAKEHGYTSAALNEADRLGHSYVGAEHVLLALVRPGESTVAARALRETGVDYDALHSLLSEDGRASARTSTARAFPPAFYGLCARADGLAIAFGAKQVEAEHLLLAMLWQPYTRITILLEQFGTSERAVQRKLAQLGAKVPPGQPPGRDDTR